MDIGVLAVVIVILVFVLIALFSSVRIAAEYERGVVFRLGRLIALCAHGLPTNTLAAITSGSGSSSTTAVATSRKRWPVRRSSSPCRGAAPAARRCGIRCSR